MTPEPLFVDPRAPGAPSLEEIRAAEQHTPLQTQAEAERTLPDGTRLSDTPPPPSVTERYGHGDIHAELSQPKGDRT